MPEAVVRWIFEEVETGATYTVEINPNEMESWLYSKDISWSKHGSRMAGIEARRGPVAETFSGIVRSKSHHDALIAWQKKPGKLRITDHLGRVFEVMAEAVDMIDRRPTGANAWRFHYTFRCQVLRRIA